MDAVLRVYEKHRWLMRRKHEPGADWFGQAVVDGRSMCFRAEAVEILRAEGPGADYLEPQ